MYSSEYEKLENTKFNTIYYKWYKVMKYILHEMNIKNDNPTIKEEANQSTVDKTKEAPKKEVQTEFPCEFCGKILKRRKTLNEHRKIHTGIYKNNTR